jgi:hypothetical protein
VWLLSLLSVGLLVHQYHLSVENKSQQEEILRLRATIVHLQEENEYLRDGSSIWNKVVFCVTTANGITSIVAGIARGATVPTTPYQAANNILYQVFGIDLSTIGSAGKIGV